MLGNSSSSSSSSSSSTCNDTCWKDIKFIRSNDVTVIAVNVTAYDINELLHDNVDEFVWSFIAVKETSIGTPCTNNDKDIDYRDWWKRYLGESGVWLTVGENDPTDEPPVLDVSGITDKCWARALSVVPIVMLIIAIMMMMTNQNDT